MYRLPAPLAAAIDAVVAEHPASKVAAAARSLSDRYLADHAATAPIIDSRLRAAAYVLTRMPATYAAARAAVEQVRLSVPDLDPRRVLDLGCGTGGVSAAVADAFDGIDELRLVDYSADALALAQRLLAGAGPRLVATQRRLGGNPVPDGGGAVDLAVCGFVLGELDDAARAAVVAELVAAAPTVVVVEPGTPAGYRRILAAREQLLAAGLTLAAPCPHHEPCPLAGDDWCHAVARLERTVAHREAKGGSRDYEDEKFSYVAATRLPVARPAARVLRHPQIRPGHVRLELCRADGTAAGVTVSKKQGAEYKAARRVAWGEGWG
ncbi:methyltransferase domain-containing protein [Occultella glacieicola]|uniref:Methyltransferase domain-containing protein n=1 Tax=Occultella glacieicola TaxID=2518684 RepID=A0ABY2E9C1_9MICO|nr:small ribosomal subunit Rsm22 family protein [Occultella glacieicola]TDE98986.1 methyltransferase domain-containing protein [Occultella glacieicola]